MTKDEELLLARKIFWLLKKDAIFLHEYNEEKDTHDGGTYLAINCNDVFVPGSDSEDLKEEDIDKYIEVVKTVGRRYAGRAWIFVKRGYKHGENSWFDRKREDAGKFEEAVKLVEGILK
jgi:hypothetical protein